MVAEVAALRRDQEEARSLVTKLEAQVEDLVAWNSNLQNNLQDTVREAKRATEEAKANVEAEQTALGNFAYICAADDYIRTHSPACSRGRP